MCCYQPRCCYELRSCCSRFRTLQTEQAVASKVLRRSCCSLSRCVKMSWLVSSHLHSPSCPTLSRRPGRNLSVVTHAAVVALPRDFSKVSCKTVCRLASTEPQRTDGILLLLRSRPRGISYCARQQRQRRRRLEASCSQQPVRRSPPQACATLGKGALRTGLPDRC